MSLTSAMNTAQSIFNNTGKQTDVTSKNIANVGNANYVKRTAILGTTMAGASIVSNGRAQNESLLRQTISSASLATGQNTVLTGLEEMKSIFGGNDYESAPSTYMKELLKSLSGYAAKPSNAALAATAVTSAADVASSLNKASAELQAMRLRADKEISLQVDKLNGLLAKFEEANNEVKAQTAIGGDPSDALDQRETLLKDISSIIGINVVNRPNNDVALYTTDGATLFEIVPRPVTFKAQPGYDATTTGNAIYVDGVALKAGSGSNTTAEGSLQGLMQVRDELAPTMQSQLDEIARGLITMFAEKPITQPAPLPTPLTAKPGLSPGRRQPQRARSSRRRRRPGARCDHYRQLRVNYFARWQSGIVARRRHQRYRLYSQSRSYGRNRVFRSDRQLCDRIRRAHEFRRVDTYRYEYQHPEIRHQLDGLARTGTVRCDFGKRSEKRAL